MVLVVVVVVVVPLPAECDGALSSWDESGGGDEARRFMPNLDSDGMRGDEEYCCSAGSRLSGARSSRSSWRMAPVSSM